MGPGSVSISSDHNWSFNTHRQAAYEKAEAEKIRTVKAAEADAESKFLAGQVGHRQKVSAGRTSLFQ